MGVENGIILLKSQRNKSIFKRQQKNHPKALRNTLVMSYELFF